MVHVVCRKSCAQRSEHTKCKSQSTKSHTSRSSHGRRRILRGLRHRSGNTAGYVRARSAGDGIPVGSVDTSGSRSSWCSAGDTSTAGRRGIALNREVAAPEDLTDIVVVGVVDVVVVIVIVQVGVCVVLLDASITCRKQSVGVGGVADALDFGIVV